MTVAVSSGVAYVTGTPTSQNSQQFRVKNSASSNVTISANASGSTKYDWVYISLNATNLNTPNTAGDNVATLTTSRSSSASTDDGTPPTYGYAIAVVTVANGETAITNSMIRDVRTQCGVSAGATTTTSTWTDTGYAPGTVTYNGNRSYSCVFSNTDLTGFLSNGMRLKLTRTTAPPTQCTDLESGSSQYWEKTSASGISFTDDFTVSAWIKLESYTGAVQVIVSRRNASTEGWEMGVDANGCLYAYALRIASNNRIATTYQSIPLNKWVHVAVSMDLSGGSALTYIDGISVPNAVVTTGTITALVQGTQPVTVGKRASSATEFFDGKVAQVGLFNAVLSASTIRSYASQTLSGSETNCIGAWTFNGNANDSSSNANNMSASGGAAATTTDSPFNSTEYGIITANSFSTDTTLTVQVPEGYAIPTSGGVSAVSYSTQDVPYGFPRDKGKWTVDMTSEQLSAVTLSTSFGAPTGEEELTVPIGAWKLLLNACIRIDSTATTIRTMIATLSSDGTTETNPLTSVSVSHDGETATTANAFTMAHSEDYVSISSATTYTLLGRVTNTANVNSANVDGTLGSVTLIRAELAYV